MKLRIGVFIFSLMLIFNLLLPSEAWPRRSPDSKTGQSAIKRLAGRKFPGTRPASPRAVQPPIQPPIQPAVVTWSAHFDEPAGPASPKQRQLNARLLATNGLFVLIDRGAGAVPNSDLIEALRSELYSNYITALTFEDFEESELEKILEPLKRLASVGRFGFNSYYVRSAYGLNEKDPELMKLGDAEAWALRQEIEGRPTNTLVVRIGGSNKPFNFFQRDFESTKLLIASLDYKGKENNPKLRAFSRLSQGVLHDFLHQGKGLEETINFLQGNDVNTIAVEFYGVLAPLPHEGVDKSEEENWLLNLKKFRKFVDAMYRNRMSLFIVTYGEGKERIIEPVLKANSIPYEAIVVWGQKSERHKDHHLNYAMMHSKTKVERNSEVLLIDHDHEDVIHARKKGFLAIEVDKDKGLDFQTFKF